MYYAHLHHQLSFEALGGRGSIKPFRRKLALRVSKEAHLLRGGDSLKVLGPLMKVMLALEIQGIPSFQGDEATDNLASIFANIPMSGKLDPHLALLLFLVSKRALEHKLFFS